MQKILKLSIQPCLRPMEADNRKIKSEIETIKRQIEQGHEEIRKMRESQVEVDNELQKVTREITDTRNNIRMAEDDNSQKVRQLVDGFRNEKFELERRVDSPIY